MQMKDLNTPGWVDSKADVSAIYPHVSYYFSNYVAFYWSCYLEETFSCSCAVSFLFCLPGQQQSLAEGLI